jgi:hypothetical protein
MLAIGALAGFALGWLCGVVMQRVSLLRVASAGAASMRTAETGPRQALTTAAGDARVRTDVVEVAGGT